MVKPQQVTPIGLYAYLTMPTWYSCITYAAYAFVSKIWEMYRTSRLDMIMTNHDYSRFKTSMYSSFFPTSWLRLLQIPWHPPCPPKRQNRRLHHPRLRFVFGHLRVLPTLWPLWHRLGRLGHVPRLKQLCLVETGQAWSKTIQKQTTNISWNITYQLILIWWWCWFAPRIVRFHAILYIFNIFVICSVCVSLFLWMHRRMWKPNETHVKECGAFQTICSQDSRLLCCTRESSFVLLCSPSALRHTQRLSVALSHMEVFWTARVYHLIFTYSSFVHVTYHVTYLYIQCVNVVSWLFHDGYTVLLYTFVSTVEATGMAAGRLATLACGLTIDGFGPISDNAGGIAEMALFNPEAWNGMEWQGKQKGTVRRYAKICEVGVARLS